MKIHQIKSKTSRERHGVISMILVVSLFAVIGAVALALDYAWLNSAQDELQVAAEAGALAAGRNLANDDLLKQEVSQEKRLLNARLSAKQIVSENLVAGQPVSLDIENNEDVRLGKLVRQNTTDKIKFIETDYQPTTVVVFAKRTRARNNPIVNLLKGVTSENITDVTSLAEATIDNRVIGVRPYKGVPIPAFPFAICKTNNEGIVGKECWDDSILATAGSDFYGYDTESSLVLNEEDGIPEMTLSYYPDQKDFDKNNFCILNLGNDFRTDKIARQIRSGWKSEDLTEQDGLIRPGINTDKMEGYFKLNGSVLDELENMIGHCRIVLLYDRYEIRDIHGLAYVDCPQLVAIRILNVWQTQDGVAKILVQPGVMTTKTAILSDQGDETAELFNRYIYKLHLTH